jgi:hypothetical protein
MIKERSFKDYNIAFGVSFLKILGYLAFPIQMAYRYPDLARFMAGHWATEAVHSVPIFGERGAWLEHFVFDAFYNFPLTVRRRMKLRAERRAKIRSRPWSAGLIALAGTALLAVLSYGYFRRTGQAAAMGKIWWLALWIPLFGGAAAALGAGGMAAGKRIFLGAASGGSMGLLYGLYMTFAPGIWSFAGPAATGPQTFLNLIDRPVRFLLEFGLLALLGAFIAETRKVR